MRVLRLCATVVCALSLAVGVASAQIATFDGAAIGTDLPYTEGIATFTGTAGAFNVTERNAFEDGAAGNVLGEIGGTGDALSVAFSSPVTGLSFEFITTDDLGITAGGMTFAASPIGDSLGNFKGIASGFAGPISNLTIAAVGGANASFAVDNFNGQAVGGAVPEPGTLAFLLGGMVPLALAIRRRRA